MRCRAGDLVVVIRCDIGLAGKISRVVCFVGDKTDLHGRLHRNVWRLEPQRGTPAHWGSADEDLRPLRDSDGEDEILRIAGKPEPITAAVVTAEFLSSDETF